MTFSVSNHLPEVSYTFDLDNGNISWRPRSFDISEGLSSLYELVVDLWTDDLDADMEELLGEGAELEIARGDYPRYVSGIIRRVDFVAIEHGHLHVRAYICPAAWVLTKGKDSRHWQNLSIIDILKDVLTAPLADFQRSIRFDLVDTYEPREFCTQYQESDYEFICRIMAEEGVYFYFDFSGGEKEVLVVCDNNDSLPRVVLGVDEDTVAICETNAEHVHCETLQNFTWQHHLRSTSVVQRDFDWRAPFAPPTDEKRIPDARGREREVYEPGERRYGKADAARISAKKVEALVTKGAVGVGEANVTGFMPGMHFSLDDHHISEIVTDHLITRVTHHGTWGNTHQSGKVQDTTYSNYFETIPLSVVFRPPFLMRKRALVHGPQTAVVTGPANQEICVDKHGRVKIILAWDRVSRPDDKSSCWVRVAQISGGPNWGSMFIPRIGMEVVVEFLEGNPDRPLITGCVYNGANPPPYPLPANQTISTIKTNSSPGGNGSNELRFEDAAGREELYFHAQKDQTLEIENDRNKTVKHDQTEAIINNKTITVGANHIEAIGVNQTITVGSMATESVGAIKSSTVGGAYVIAVGGALSEVVGAAKTVHVAGVSSATAGTVMKLTCGASSITLSASGDVVIKGTKIALQANVITGN